MRVLVVGKSMKVFDKNGREQLKCDRCGRTHGSRRKFHITVVTEEMEVAGKLWDICNECQTKLIGIH